MLNCPRVWTRPRSCLDFSVLLAWMNVAPSLLADPRYIIICQDPPLYFAAHMLSSIISFALFRGSVLTCRWWKRPKPVMHKQIAEQCKEKYVINMEWEGMQRTEVLKQVNISHSQLIRSHTHTHTLMISLLSRPLSLVARARPRPWLQWRLWFHKAEYHSFAPRWLHSNGCVPLFIRSPAHTTSRRVSKQNNNIRIGRRTQADAVRICRPRQRVDRLKPVFITSN